MGKNRDTPEAVYFRQCFVHGKILLGNVARNEILNESILHVTGVSLGNERSRDMGSPQGSGNFLQYVFVGNASPALACKSIIDPGYDGSTPIIP